MCRLTLPGLSAARARGVQRARARSSGGAPARSGALAALARPPRRRCRPSRRRRPPRAPPPPRAWPSAEREAARGRASDDDCPEVSGARRAATSRRRARRRTPSSNKITGRVFRRAGRGEEPAGAEVASCRVNRPLQTPHCPGRARGPRHFSIAGARLRAKARPPPAARRPGPPPAARRPPPARAHAGPPAQAGRARIALRRADEAEFGPFNPRPCAVSRLPYCACKAFGRPPPGPPTAAAAVRAHAPGGATRVPDFVSARPRWTAPTLPGARSPRRSTRARAAAVGDLRGRARRRRVREGQWARAAAPRSRPSTGFLRRRRRPRARWARPPAPRAARTAARAAARAALARAAALELQPVTTGSRPRRRRPVHRRRARLALARPACDYGCARRANRAPRRPLR